MEKEIRSQFDDILDAKAKASQLRRKSTILVFLIVWFLATIIGWLYKPNLWFTLLGVSNIVFCFIIMRSGSHRFRKWLKYYSLYAWPVLVSLITYFFLSQISHEYLIILLLPFLIFIGTASFSPMVFLIEVLPKKTDLIWVPFVCTLSSLVIIYYAIDKLGGDVQKIWALLGTGLVMIITAAASVAKGNDLILIRKSFTELNKQLESANKALEYENDLLSQKVNSLFLKSSDLILLVDGTCGIIDVSEPFLSKIKKSREQLLGLPLNNIVLNGNKQAFMEFANSSNVGDELLVEGLNVPLQNNDLMLATASFRNSHKEGDKSIFIVILRDITDFELRQMRDHELMSTFGTVMRNLNHNLRGPLSTAMGVTLFYELKNKENKNNAEGFNMIYKQLENLDKQLAESIKGLEGYEKVWMTDYELQSKKTIVLIDDDEKDLLILNKLLLDINPDFDITTFSDSQMAVFYLQNLTKKVEYIFIDLEMPNLNGHEVLRKIVEKKLHMVHDIYFISGHDFSYLESLELKSEEFEMVKGFIPKPFKIDQLKQIIKV